MTSSKRERELARQRYERKQERLEAEAQQKKQRQVVVAVVLAVLALIAAIWLIVSLVSDDSTDQSAQPTPTPTATEPTPTPSVNPANLQCDPAPPARAAEPQFPDGPVDVAVDPARGTWGWYLDMTCGLPGEDGTVNKRVTVEFLPEQAPETVNSMLFLSDRNQWYDNSSCHRLTTEGIFVLQCGDPTLTGTGGPGYSVPDENLPAADGVNYPAGTVAMANSGPNTNGSQFFLVYEDTTLPPNYTIFGTIVEGLDIIQAIAASGVEGGGVDGTPAQPVGFAKVVGYITQEVAQ